MPWLLLQVLQDALRFSCIRCLTCQQCGDQVARQVVISELSLQPSSRESCPLQQLVDEVSLVALRVQVQPLQLLCWPAGVLPDMHTVLRWLSATASAGCHARPRSSA